MKRIQYHRYGGPEVLQLEEAEVPAPGKAEMLVRVLAASANPADYKVRDGFLKLFTGQKFPRGLGHDFAGIVEQTGEGITRFRPGDEVFGGLMARPSGAFSQYAVVEEKYTALKPSELSFDEAACIATAGSTGMNAITRGGKVQAGQKVFITGCLGAVGHTAAQFALAAGASVGGSCRDTARADAEAMGLNPVVGFNFDPAPFKGLFDLIVDNANAIPIDMAITMLKPTGRIIDPVLSPAKLLRSLFSRQYKVLLVPFAYKELELLARAGAEKKVTFPIARRATLNQAIEALTDFEVHHLPKGGKLVIQPWG